MSRLAATIDQSVPKDQQRAVTSVAAVARPVHPTTEQVQDPEQLARYVHDLQIGLQEATKVARSQHRNGAIIFSNVTCGASGTKLTPLAHGFGRFAYWNVVGWRGIEGAATTTSAPFLVDDQNDASDVLTDENTLSLRSYVAGTADIEVF